MWLQEGTVFNRILTSLELFSQAATREKGSDFSLC